MTTETKASFASYRSLGIFVFLVRWLTAALLKDFKMFIQGRRSIILCIVTVAASGVCLAQEEPVAVVRSGAGDYVRLTTQDGVCKNGRCQGRARTYQVGEMGERPCVEDSVLQGGKQ